MSGVAIVWALALFADPGGELLVLGPQSFHAGLPTSTVAVAQPIDEPPGLFQIRDGWRFRMGDDPAWADPAFDDRDWDRKEIYSRDPVPEGWTGIGWFRKHFTLTAGLAGVELAAMMFYLGAFELYVDGKLIGGNGDLVEASRPKVHLSKVPVGVWSRAVFSLPAGGDHVFAFRYALPTSADLSYFNLPFGCAFVVGEPAAMASYTKQRADRSLATMFGLGGVVATIALLHLLLFLFQPSLIQNLYFSLSTLGLLGIVYVTSADPLYVSMVDVMRAGKILRLSVVAVGGFGALAQYALFAPRTPAQLQRSLTVLFVVFAFSLFAPIMVVYGVSTLMLLEQVRIVGRAVIRKQRGAWIAALGSIVFIVLAISQMFLGEIVPEFTLALGMVAMMLALSVLLARNFADTNRGLAKEIVERREQEVSRKLLEVSNAHQAEQLLEAAKLEAAHRELKAATEDLKRTQVQLAQSEKMASLGLLVAGIAHEINTPVGAISSMRDSLGRALEKLKRGLSDGYPAALESQPIVASLGVMADAIKVIESGSARVTEIVKRLRSFARLDESLHQTVDIHEGIEDTLLLVAHELRHGITVERRFSALPKIECQPSRLNQVFLNIIINARQAMGDKGTLTIETGVVGDRAEVKISDTGPGIRPEHLRRIFDPGFTTKGVGVGTGLGLSICYQIIKDHLGEIRVDSELGKGTTFTISLPLSSVR